MKQEIDNVQNIIASLKNRSKELQDIINSMTHKDVAVNMFINKLKKASFHSMDIFGEMEKQLVFLKNEQKSFELREKQKKQREEEIQRQEIQRKKNRSY